LRCEVGRQRLSLWTIPDRNGISWITMTPVPPPLFLIAGSGLYPRLVLRGARAAGVPRVAVAAFHGETDPALADEADSVVWLKVGQLGKLIQTAREAACPSAIMAGQLAPSNLFQLRPDFRALVILARLRERNAETLFGAVADELARVSVAVLPATTYMEEHLASPGVMAGPRLKPRHRQDLDYGFRIAKEVSRLDIGQTVVVKNGTVLAVEGFEGTNDCLLRGGTLGRGDATMVKVSKPAQDLRFDVPVIGEVTLQTAHEAGLRRLGVEAGRCLLLDRPAVLRRADALSLTLYGIESPT
jgi:DUF1009 family protein